VNEKLTEALKSISDYIKNKKPKTDQEAKHMLNVISIIASETLLDETAKETA